jgi:hypothetical protein
MMGEISFANSDMTTITLLVSGLLHDNTLNSDTRRKTQRQMPKPTTTDTTSTRLDFVLTTNDDYDDQLLMMRNVFTMFRVSSRFFEWLGSSAPAAGTGSGFEFDGAHAKIRETHPVFCE